MGRFLIILGIMLVLGGVLWPVLQKAGFGRLPGDIVIERQGFRLYLPIASSILASVVLSVLFLLVTWLSGR